MAQATDGHHATLGELVSAQVSSEKFLVGTDSADTYFLVDHIHSAEAVEADLIETLFARLVDGVEAGARVLFFAAVKRARLGRLSLQVPCSCWLWGRGWDDFLLNLLLGLELLFRGPRTHFCSREGGTRLLGSHSSLRCQSGRHSGCTGHGPGMGGEDPGHIGPEPAGQA